MIGRDAPARERFTPAELEVIAAHRTPRQVQQYLRALPYNWSRDGGRTLRTLRGVVAHGTASCIEAALAAAAILEQHGHPPLLLDLESQDQLDHVLCLYRGPDGRLGTVAKSRDAGLHGRRALFRSVRDLVASYLDPYVDLSGRIVGYGVADLRELVPRCDWRLSTRNVWAVEEALIAMPHTPLAMGEDRYRRALRKYRAFRARWPGRQATFYPDRDRWL
jgi:hypothetical protein